MYEEQYCFLTILAYYLYSSIDCCYIKLTSILFVFWDALDCEQEKQYLLWKDRQGNFRIQNTKKKPNKQKRKHPLQKTHKKQRKNQTNKQNQTGTVFSVFRDVCLNIRYILQFQITTCIFKKDCRGFIVFFWLTTPKLVKRFTLNYTYMF